MIRRALVLAALAALAATASAAASRHGFDASAHLVTVGCKTVINGSAVSVKGCSAKAPLAGKTHGTMALRYTAKVDIGRGRGRQHGTVTLRGRRAADLAVLRFTGSVTIGTGASHGTWKATVRRGAFARTPRTGTYTSRTPDQGLHVVFDVRG